MTHQPEPRFVLLRGGALPRYVRRLEPDIGVVLWTYERPRALPLEQGQAHLVQAQIVARPGCDFAVAVVPA